MPIHHADPPDDLAQTVRATLDQLQPGRTPYDPSSGGGVQDPDAAPELALALPLYYLRLDRLAAGDGLDAAEPNGWRTLVRADGETVAHADATATPERTEVRQISRGPAVVGLTAASSAAPEAAQDDDYEERVLQVPGISLTAVWLHAESGTDRLIPADPAPEGVRSGESYAAADLLAAVRPLAADHLTDTATRAQR